MLTIEMLRQNSALTGLSDAQLTAIAEMSRNDENTVIGTRIGALHGQYDKDILEVTGIAKKDGEKSYDYAKRVLNEYKTKIASSSELQTKLDAANTKVAELNAKIEKGEGDAAIRQQLKDTKAQVTQLQAQLQTKQSEFDAEKAKLEGKIKDTHIDYAFATATAGLKFKAGIPETVQKVLLNSAKSEVLAKGTPDFIEDGKGGTMFVMRDANGLILNNPKNNLNPYTIQELVMETSLKDVIDTGIKQTGGGTSGSGGQGGQGGNPVFSTAGAKTQVEADTMIENYLLQQGLTRDSVEFGEQTYQLRTENEVAKLPIR